MKPIRFAILFLAGWALAAAAGPEYTISSVAGSDMVGDGGPAILAQLGGAEGVAIDKAGNVYIADAIDHRVRKVSPGGLITTVAGNGHPGFKGDDGPAVAALLDSPYGLAVDLAGNLYIADLGNGRVRCVSTGGTIRTVAGGGLGRPNSDGGDPLASKISPRNVAVASDGTLYISDFADHRIYKISREGRISLFSGTGVVQSPAGLALDAAGALYVADSGNNRVLKIEQGRILTVAGGEKNALTVNTLYGPTGVAVDPAGNLYIVDSGNRRVLKRTLAGVISEAGNIAPDPPRDVAVDPSGLLYVAAGKRVLKVLPFGAAAPFAGNGTFGFLGDGGPALEAHLFYPSAVAADSAGNLFIADQRNSRVRKVDAGGRISTLAGGRAQGDPGDGGPAILARLITPSGIAPDALGRLWIADQGAHRVRLVSPGGVIETLAGTGEPGFQGDGGRAWSAQLFSPSGIAIDRAGNAYIADAFNHRVRKISPEGVITTAAGRGVPGYGGDGGLASEAQLDTPRAVALDGEGNLYVAEYANHCVRRLTPAGRIETVAGTGRRGFSGDGGPAVGADLNHPLGVAVDLAGTLYIADADNHRVRAVALDGVIRTIAGDGTPGFAGDGGPAASARLYFPSGVAAGPAGEIYVADSWNHRVRKLTPVMAAPVQVEPLIAIRVVHAASLVAGPIAPGQLVTILGVGLGTALSLADAQVLFDETPAPVLSVQDDQIQVQAPYGIARQTATVIEVQVREDAARARQRARDHRRAGTVHAGPGQRPGAGGERRRDPQHGPESGGARFGGGALCHRRGRFETSGCGQRGRLSGRGGLRRRGVRFPGPDAGQPPPALRLDALGCLAADAHRRHDRQPARRNPVRQVRLPRAPPPLPAWSIIGCDRTQCGDRFEPNPWRCCDESFPP